MIPVGSLGSDFEPKSPCLLFFVSMKDSCVDTHFGPPPAIPQESNTGAFPGARHGFHRNLSSDDRGSASLLYVQKDLLLFVAVKLFPQRSCMFGFDSSPSQDEHPILHPCENHMHVWPTSQGSVPFTQVHAQHSPNFPISSCAGCSHVALCGRTPGPQSAPYV